MNYSFPFILAIVLLAVITLNAYISQRHPTEPFEVSQVPTSVPSREPGECPEYFVVPQTEGPYYTAGSPQRTNITEKEHAGQPLIVTGIVFDRNCRPIPGAWLDFWQADEKGEYDNQGYRFRGHQFTDAQGNYRLETVMPGEYPGRTNHIHVKLRAERNDPVVTSQLYFPGASTNESDSIFDPRMVVSLDRENFKLTARFNFKLDIAL